MKICMLDPLFFPYFGGTEKVVLEVGSRLAKNHGHEVEVLTSMIPQAKGVAREEIKGMRVHRTPSLYFGKLPLPFLPPPFTVSPLLNLDLLSAHNGADVYHLHNRFWYYWGTLASVKLLLRKKLMLTIHNARPKGIAPDVDFWGGLWDDTLGLATFSACDRINCVSRATLDATIPARMHGKCAVVYNGVDTKAFSPERGAGNVRKKFGIPENAPLILSNARLVTQKGFGYLLEAFAELRKEKAARDARLLVIGKGPLKEELLAKARALGVADSFQITTGIPEEELSLYYNAADVFALASLYEPSAVVLYEALACGKPIVATDAGGNPEIVSADCGFIVPARDPAALKEKLFLVLSEDALRRKLSSASRRRAQEKFDWDIIAREWDKSYKALF
ncbi:MAG: glycosyltransferase family 4 protein [Candidatus ainarchaeum sp.]|nr:glycosyltransferase family 4 protein [Candidatus ainarchaeum sp.]